ncbi:MAG: hypothetical protein IJX63_07410 [Lachnospiraceae bacterium]|nr:hypothetical protein [Lachnospiraceae bacterium]
MSYEGKWKFHSIGTVDDETCERVWLNAEEYMNSPMPYVDETDEEAVADEMKERKKTVGTILEVCEDGKLYALMPLPEGVSEKEVEAAVKAGVIKVRDGMMTDDPFTWEERDGALWVDMGIGDDGFVNFSEEDEFLTMLTTRYERMK